MSELWTISQMGYRKILPDPSNFVKKVNAKEDIDGMACDIWELDQTTLNTTSLLVGVYRIFTDPATGLPRRYKFFGHNTLFGGSHSDGAKHEPEHLHNVVSACHMQHVCIDHSIRISLALVWNLVCPPDFLISDESRTAACKASIGKFPYGLWRNRALPLFS